MDIQNYKHCFSCDTVYPKSFFFNNKARYDNLSTHCKTCHFKDTSARIKKMRKKAIDKYGGKCVKCGYDKDIRALQFDHVYSDGHIERKINDSPTFILKNILKDTEGRYQLLCANCNAIKVDEAGERLKKIIIPKPIIGELREAVLAAKNKPGGQLGSKRPNQSIKMKEVWAKSKNSK